MDRILLIIESFLYFLNLEMIMTKIMGYRKKNYIGVFLLLLVYIFLGFIAALGKSVFIFVYMVVQIIQIILIRLINKNSKTITVVGIYLLFYSITLLTTAFFESVFLLSVVQSFSVELILYGLLFLVSLFCCYQKNINSKIICILNILSPKFKILLLAYLLINTLVLALILSFIPLNEMIFWNVALRITIALLSIFVFVLAPIIIIITLSNSYLKSQNETFQKDIEAQAKHYSDLAKANYELRRFKHDFNNIKIGLEKTLNDNDCEAALSIIENSNYEIQNPTEKMLEFDTGNGIVDALLSDKQNKANKSNTRIVFSGSVPPDSIAPTDLCVLFGNTLDNAIEACEKFEDETEKTIFVSCKCNSGFAFISITNPVAEDVVIHGNSIDSTKSDKASHGYGLYSLSKIVKKLDGSLNLSCEDRIFKVEIDLSLEQIAIYA